MDSRTKAVEAITRLFERAPRSTPENVISELETRGFLLTDRMALTLKDMIEDVCMRASTDGVGPTELGVRVVRSYHLLNKIES